jgi:hypothetical protein
MLAGLSIYPSVYLSICLSISNPELSLFEALRVGGFDYSADEDASITDAEKVTLGQRKNQLSRRLRLARKQQDDTMAGGGGFDHHHNGTSNMLDDSLVPGLGGMAGLGGMSHAAKMKLHLQQQHQSTASGAAMSSEAQRQLEKLMQHSQQAKLSSGVKRAAQFAELGPDAEMHPNDEDTILMDDKQNARRMAKFHPQYQPLFIPRAASLRNSYTTGSSQLSSQLASTPQLGPLTAPLTPLAGPPSTGFATAATSGSSLFPTASGLLGQTQNNLAQRRTAGIASHPSGVAVASLSATAQSVGLSLEQLAVALSSSSNLVKVLSNNSGSEQQQELALRLFRNESRALYQRCMLLAGFRPDDAEEKSQSHLQFAFSAWQMEGKRLQDLMGDEVAGRHNNSSSANRLTATRTTNASTSVGLNGSSLSGMLGINGHNSMAHAASERAAQQQLQEEMQRQQQQLQLQQGQQFKQEQQQLLQTKHDHHRQGSNDHRNGHSHNNNDHLSGHNHGGHGQGQASGHSHAHGHSHEQSFDGHHVHQLEGKCGHKAIIHQPKDGSAHIDFVVGDKVECYHGIQPLGNKSVSVWPSKYKCQDLSCPAPCADQACEDEVQPVELDIHGRAPKILDLSDIDLSGAEWNSDLNGMMGGTLLGLFKLGDSDKDNDEAVTQVNSNGGDGYGIQV